MAEHTIRGNGPMHAGDCPRCVEDAAERDARHEATNPHRPGTKVYAERVRMDRGASIACDPRYERYWTM